MRVLRSRSRSAGRAAAVLAAAALLAAGAPAAALAGTLTRAELARRFPDPLLVGEREKDLPVWPIFKQGGPPAFQVELVGYAFESIDLAPVPGFSGTPVDLLVALGTQGEFLDVAVLSQHEPVFLGGVGEEPLHRFLTQYKGRSLKQNITVASAAAKVSHPGSANVYLDGVAKATASLRIINQSVLAAALRVARARLGFAAGREPDRVAHVREDLYEPRTWKQLVDAGLVQKRVLTNRDVERAFAGKDGRGLDAEALAHPDDVFCELWVALVTVPTAGRNLLTDAAWKLMNDRIRTGDHVLLVLSRGRHRFVSEMFQRNTIPDALSLRQGGLPIEIRDLDIDAPLRAIGQPDFDLAMTFRVIFQSGLDPGEPMQISTRVTRSRGFIAPERYSQDFGLDYAVPGRFLIPAPEEERTWPATWKARKVDLAVLAAALALLSYALARQSPLVSRARRLRWFRPAFLVFTLGYVGWYAQGQLSIVNVVALLQATLASRSWSFYLYDPLATVLSVYAVAALVLWGRGTFCGWLCPFGAMQELVATVARRLGLRRWRLGADADRRLKRVKYAVLAAILVAAAISPRFSDPLMELEPFKTAVTMRFERTWPFVAYAAATLALGAVIYKGFCRYLCPLGAALALAGRLRRFRWIARRLECGTPCQTCARRCEYQAIDAKGRVDYAECFQCMDCVAVYNSDELCAPRILALRGKQMRPVGAPPRPPAAEPTRSRGTP
jgi:NosR/NirI family transcriptional regulator, nitrous oxide reductase regulator